MLPLLISKLLQRPFQSSPKREESRPSGHETPFRCSYPKQEKEHEHVVAFACLAGAAGVSIGSLLTVGRTAILADRRKVGMVRKRTCSIMQCSILQQ